ncbi:hypothetical protein HZZ13_23425 [Bradyrhizobium sp. CNPSo 4010]|uniref:Uncharacterized protein n=1 Tax=Bradyrhizobium agreste TaxID=2751811 RepID=A0ABS0PV26_9BRAD|nr:hypothetical protein [Bradyrhizobium agreste]MBH5400714.1 hypothetical protein [Bradyrhizobium agreste]
MNEPAQTSSRNSTGGDCWRDQGRALTQTLILISVEEKYSQQIIKTDQIAFCEVARMSMTKLDAPSIVLAAQRIKVTRPGAYSII